MPRRPMHSCAHAGCPALTDQRYCPTHARQHERQRGTKQQRGYGGAWDAMRAQVLAEQPICAACGQSYAVEVHHIRPLRLGGTHDRANLVGLCRPCHHRITAAQR